MQIGDKWTTIHIYIKNAHTQNALTCLEERRCISKHTQKGLLVFMSSLVVFILSPRLCLLSIVCDANNVVNVKIIFCMFPDRCLIKRAKKYAYKLILMAQSPSGWSFILKPKTSSLLLGKEPIDKLRIKSFLTSKFTWKHLRAIINKLCAAQSMTRKLKTQLISKGLINSSFVQTDIHRLELTILHIHSFFYANIQKKSVMPTDTWKKYW